MLAHECAVGGKEENGAVERTKVALDDADYEIHLVDTGGSSEGVGGGARNVHGALPVASKLLPALGRAHTDTGTEVDAFRIGRNERFGEDHQLCACLSG